MTPAEITGNLCLMGVLQVARAMRADRESRS
jgi:hypothetical protein